MSSQFDKHLNLEKGIPKKRKGFLGSIKDIRVILQILGISIAMIALILTISRSGRRSIRIDFEMPRFLFDSQYQGNQRLIEWKSKTIKDVYLTRIFITNTGRSALKPDNFSGIQALQLKLEQDPKILAWRIEQNAGQSSDSLIYNINRQTLAYYFELINRKDTVVLSILHGGKERLHLSVVGKLENGSIRGPFCMENSYRSKLGKFSTCLKSLFGLPVLGKLFIFILLLSSTLKSFLAYDGISARESRKLLKASFFLFYVLSDLFLFGLFIILMLF